MTQASHNYTKCQIHLRLLLKSEDSVFIRLTSALNLTSSPLIFIDTFDISIC